MLKHITLLSILFFLVDNIYAQKITLTQTVKGIITDEQSGNAPRRKPRTAETRAAIGRESRLANSCENHRGFANSGSPRREQIHSVARRDPETTSSSATMLAASLRACWR